MKYTNSRIEANILVHSCFFDAKDGISIDHITHHGTRPKDDYMSYGDFEAVFERQNAIIAQLAELYNATTPIPSFSREAIAAIENTIAIDSSPNVIRFIRKRPKSET